MIIPQIEKDIIELLRIAGIWYEAKFLRFIGAAPGVYLFYDNDIDQVMYVGKANNLLARLKSHEKYDYDKMWTIYTIRFAEEDSARMHQIERAFINIFNPPLNKDDYGVRRR